MLSDTDLIVSSRIIVTGRVNRVTCAWDDAGSMIWTYIEVLSDRVLKGELAERTIVLKQLGGEVGETGLRVSGQSEFRTGERVLLYLNSSPDGTLHTAHAFIGKFSVVTDPTGREFVERSTHPAEVEVLSHTDAEITNRAPLDEYVANIQHTLHKEAVRVAEIDSSRAGEALVAVPADYFSKRRKSQGFQPQFLLFAGGVRWMEADSGQAIRFFVNPNNSPIAGGATAELGRAMDAWPTQSGAGVRLQVAGQTSACGIAIDNVNTISFGDCLSQLDPPIGCAGVVALTAAAWSGEVKIIGGVSFKRLVESDVIFNDGMDCFLSTSANLAEVACHELGHAIGLDHSGDPAALMRPSAHGRGRDAALGNDDKAGVLAIYPSTSGGGPPPSTPVSITSSGMAIGTVGQFYSSTLAATGGTSPYRWSLVGGSLPPGLSLSTQGRIEGFPTVSSSFSFAAQVVDSSNPVRLDSKWLTITIQDNGGGSLVPSIDRIKRKGTKKLWVFGINFRANSVVFINGVVFHPRSFEQNGTVTQVLVKGKLNLGPTGTNVVFVVTDTSSSAPFFF